MAVAMVRRSEWTGAIPPAPDSSASMPQSDPAWCDVLRDAGEDADALLAVDGETVIGWLPFARRDSPIGTVFSSTPYLAYGGPIVAGDDPAVIRALIRAYRQAAIEAGAVAATIGTPPFLSEQVERVWRDELAPTFVFENFVQTATLDRHPVEAMSKHSRDTRKSEVRRAVDAGYRVEREAGRDAFEAWLHIYRERYQEIGASPYPSAFFEALYERILRAGKAELWTSVIGDEIAGGTLFLVDATTVDYFAAAYATPHRTYTPQQMVLSRAFGDFISRGIRRVNWESSPSRGGVFAYKARWGGVEGKHFYYSLVLDRSILRHGADEIRTAFPLRFVVPFSELERR